MKNHVAKPARELGMERRTEAAVFATKLAANGNTDAPVDYGRKALFFAAIFVDDRRMDSRINSRARLEKLDRDECMRLLAQAPLGRLAVVVAGHPLVFPVNFALDGDAVVLRTDKGTKLHGARNGPVAFECDGIDLTYHTGWSVLIHAHADEVHNPIEIARLERLPLGRWCPGPKSTWLRLRATTVSGRRIPTYSSKTEDELPCP